MLTGCEDSTATMATETVVSPVQTTSLTTTKITDEQKESDEEIIEKEYKTVGESININDMNIKLVRVVYNGSSNENTMSVYRLAFEIENKGKSIDDLLLFLQNTCDITVFDNTNIRLKTKIDYDIYSNNLNKDEKTKINLILSTQKVWENIEVKLGEQTYKIVKKDIVTAPEMINSNKLRLKETIEIESVTYTILGAYKIENTKDYDIEIEENKEIIRLILEIDNNSNKDIDLYYLLNETKAQTIVQDGSTKQAKLMSKEELGILNKQEKGRFFIDVLVTKAWVNLDFIYQPDYFDSIETFVWQIDKEEIRNNGKEKEEQLVYGEIGKVMRLPYMKCKLESINIKEDVAVSSDDYEVIQVIVRLKKETDKDIIEEDIETYISGSYAIEHNKFERVQTIGSMKTGTFENGEEIECVLSYEIPKDWVSFELKYAPQYYENNIVLVYNVDKVDISM